MSIQAFKINIPQAALDDLRERLARTFYCMDPVGQWIEGGDVL